MIKASEIRKKVEKRKAELKQAKELKMKQDQINVELLEVEKALNEFNRNIDKDNFDVSIKYITVPILVSIDVLKILEKEGYSIVRYFKGNETHLYFNNKIYTRNIGVAESIPCTTTLGDDLGKQDKLKTTLDTNANSFKTELHNSKVEDECTITTDDGVETFLEKIMNNSNWKIYRINQTSKY